MHSISSSVRFTATYKNQFKIGGETRNNAVLHVLFKMLKLHIISVNIYDTRWKVELIILYSPDGSHERK